MISTNNGSMDLNDVGVLYLALVNHVEEREEETDTSVVAVGHGVLLALAGSAVASIAAQAPDEGDNWDSCLWFERLERTDEDSLAAALVEGAKDTDSIVAEWLKSLGYAPRDDRQLEVEASHTLQAALITVDPT